jgi:hypothetical protein
MAPFDARKSLPEGPNEDDVPRKNSARPTPKSWYRYKRRRACIRIFKLFVVYLVIFVVLAAMVMLIF